MRVENVKINQIKFTVMKSILLPIIVIVFLMKMISHKNSKINPAHGNKDTVFVKMPENFDTAHIKYSHPGITRIILEKFNFKGFIAGGAISFDIGRSFDFRINCNEALGLIGNRNINSSQLSDSLIQSHQDFFKRHTFFVIISRQDTCFFYKAVGNYMNKNLDNDVQYDSTKSGRSPN
jgi:hypothetical protein